MVVSDGSIIDKSKKSGRYYVSKGLWKASRIKLEKTTADNIIAAVRHMPTTFANEFLQKLTDKTTIRAIRRRSLSIAI